MLSWASMQVNVRQGSRAGCFHGLTTKREGRDGLPGCFVTSQEARRRRWQIALADGIGGATTRSARILGGAQTFSNVFRLKRVRQPAS